MALPTSGPISLADIQTEFGGTNPIGLDEYYRGGLYVTSNNTNVPTSGAISLSNFYGAAKQFNFTISSNQTNANLRSLAVAAGWDQVSPVGATVASDVYLVSNSTGTPALTVNGSFPGGVSLINGGNIYGMGGAGGRGGIGNPLQNALNGSPGGLAVSVSSAISITNNGVISGGGGGGGGGAGSGNGDEIGIITYGGGGGGGGRVNGAGALGGSGSQPALAGGTGGTATLTAVGAGGAKSTYGGAGGAGGDNAAAGQSGGVGTGNYGSSSPGSGGAGGAAVSGNANITWVVTGTRYGAIA